MKLSSILKISCTILISIVLFLYIVFLTIVPYVLRLDKYKSEIERVIKENVKLDVGIESARLITTYDLKVGLSLNGIEVKYPKSDRIGRLSNLKIDISLWPLLFKKIEINRVELKSLSINLRFLDRDRIDLVNYIEANVKKRVESTEKSVVNGFELSEKMPKIIVNNYDINIFDKSFGREDVPLRLTGRKLVVKDILLNKSIRFITQGSIGFNKVKYVDYEIDIDTYLPNIKRDDREGKVFLRLSNPFINLVEYDLKCKIETNLKVRRSVQSGEVVIKGISEVKDLSYRIKNRIVQDSFIKLRFAKQKFHVDSNIFVTKGKPIVLRGFLSYGKRGKDIDLDVKAKEVELRDIKDLSEEFCEILNIENDLKHVNVLGRMNADFNIKTNLRHVKSGGYFNLDGGQISYDKIPLKITGIKSRVNLANSEVEIRDTEALINDKARFIVKGRINSNAYGNINVVSQELPIAVIYQAIAPKDLQKNYRIEDGVLNFNVELKGKLNRIDPKVKLCLMKLRVMDELSNIVLKVSKSEIDTLANVKKLNGKIFVEGLEVDFVEQKSVIKSVNKLIVDIENGNLKIGGMEFRLNGSEIRVSGVVKDILKRMRSDLLIKCKVRSSDIKNFLPRTIPIISKGTLPLYVRIKTEGQTTNIEGQVYADSLNNVTLFNINELQDKGTVLNLSAKMTKDELSVNELSLYKSSSNVFSENLATNISHNGLKYIDISGKITNIVSVNPKIEGLKVITPQVITFSLPNIASKVSLKSDITVSGSVKDPKVKGYLKLLNISIPSYNIKSQELNITLNSDITVANCQSLEIGDSKFSFDAVGGNILESPFVLKDININSPFLNLDALSEMSSRLPQNGNGTGSRVPLLIKYGKMNIQKLKMGDMIISNVKSEFDLMNNELRLKNIESELYGGKVVGEIVYNILYTSVMLELQGRGLNANGIVSNGFNLKDQIFGSLDFDANVKTRGVTIFQQLQSLRGETNFVIHNGQLGDLGKFEHFMYAQNLISKGVLKTTLNSTIQAISPKNTGQFRYLNGHLVFSNGWLNLSPIKSSGNNMSLYMTGRFNMLNNWCDLVILGKISEEVVKVLGPMGDMSLSSLLENMGKFGSNLSQVMNTYNVTTSSEYIEKIPSIGEDDKIGRNFKVEVKGNIYSLSSIKSFKWLYTSQEGKEASKRFTNFLNSSSTGQTDYISVPELKEKIKDNIRLNVEEKKKDLNSKMKKKFPDFLKNLP